MQIKGKIWKFGDDINTDEIIPARYLNTSDHAELAKHVMEDADKDFPEKVQNGDIIVAGKNFGCGSSREHAPIAIKAAGINAVVAKSFARIFYRNSFNIGLSIFESEELFEKVENDDEIIIDVDNGIIKINGSNDEYKTTVLPEFIQNLIKEGGLINYIKSSRSRVVE